MAIDPNLQPVDNRRVVPQAGTTDATSAAESSQTDLFAGITEDQANHRGLQKEFKDANTDGDKLIDQGEYDYYQAHKNDPVEESEDTEDTETDPAAESDDTETTSTVFDGTRTTTGAGSTVFDGTRTATGATVSIFNTPGDTTGRTTNPAVLNPSAAASVSTDVYSQFAQAQAKAKTDTTATSGDTETDSTGTKPGDTTTSTTSESKSKSLADLSHIEFLDLNNLHPNMTKQEAIDSKNSQLIYHFETYDKNKDEIISWEEFENYCKEIHSNTAQITINFEKNIEDYMKNNNCTRVEAIQAINNQKSNEVLSKQEGILDNLKYDKSKIDLSKTEALSKEELDNLSEKLKSIEGVRVGMTREQASRIGGKTEELFNQICPEGKDKIELIDILKYASGVPKDSDDDEMTARIVKTLTSNDSATRLNMEKQIFTAMYGRFDIDNMSVREREETLSATLYEILGYIEDDSIESYLNSMANAIDCHMDDIDKFETASTEDKGKMVGGGLRNLLHDDMDVRGITFYNTVKRIREGNDEYLNSLGIDHNTLSEEEIERYALESTVNRYVQTIQLMLEKMAADISNETDPEKKAQKNEELSAIIGGLKEAFQDVPQIRQLIETITIESVQGEQEKQKLVEEAVDRGDFQVTEGNKDSVISTGSTSLILNEGSEETIGEFLHQNADYIEDVQFIAEDVIASMPDSPQKTQLSEFISNTIDEIIALNNSSSSSGGSSSTSGKGNNSSSAQQTVYSLLQWNAQQNNAPKFTLDILAPQNQDFQNSDNVTDVIGSGADQSSINHAAFRISKEYKDAIQLRYAQARVQNMSKTKMFELVAKNFDRIPDQYKEDVINYFKQMPTQLLVETAIENDAVKDFMFEHKFIKMEDIVNYVRKHPQLLESGNKQISDSLKEQLNDYAKEQKLEDIKV